MEQGSYVAVAHSVPSILTKLSQKAGMSGHGAIGSYGLQIANSKL
jgi:hypothetical protein